VIGQERAAFPAGGGRCFCSRQSARAARETESAGRNLRSSIDTRRKTMQFRRFGHTRRTTLMRSVASARRPAARRRPAASRIPPPAASERQPHTGGRRTNRRTRSNVPRPAGQSHELSPSCDVRAPPVGCSASICSTFVDARVECTACRQTSRNAHEFRVTTIRSRRTAAARINCAVTHIPAFGAARRPASHMLPASPAPRVSQPPTLALLNLVFARQILSPPPRSPPALPGNHRRSAPV
jgi:hypothetical protein